MFPGSTPANLEVVRDLPHAVVEAPTLWIPLADGTCLAARLWRPDVAEPVPAVLEAIPYRRRDGTVADDERIHPYFAGHGFASLRLDLRGSGDSEGRLADEYLPLEQEDLCQVIAWIAAQPWCSGAVGMMGLSWGGFNSLQTAARRPPALKAIIAVGATVDRYNDDVHYKNGCLMNENFGWGSSFLSFQTRPPDPEVVGAAWRDLWLARLDGLAFFAEAWFAHPARDAYWQHGSVCEDYGAIRVPVMIVTGWGDLYVNAVPRLLENLSVPCRALAGPWAHQFPHLATPGPAVDFLGQALDWWRRWLKGEDLPDPPAYSAYCQAGRRPDPFAAELPGHWVEAAAWPPPDLSYRAYFLTASGLAEEPAAAPVRAVRSPLDCGSAGGELIPHCLGPELPGDQRADDGGSLLFDSPPLAAPLDIWGDPVAELTLASDRPTGNLIARLCDVSPDGASERVTWGCLALSHRDGNADPKPVPVGEPVRLRLSLDHVAHRFPAGHRLRLALSTAYWPLVWPAADDPTLTLAPKAARLTLPVYEGPAAAPPAGPKAPPAAELRSLRPAANQRRLVTDLATGATELQIRDDYGETEVAAHGLSIGALKREAYRIVKRDPASASAELQWTHSLGRGGWQVRTETETRLTCDADAFHLEAKVTAFEGDARVFEKAWRSSHPRR